MDGRQFSSNENSRRKCPICKAPFVSEKKLLRHKDFVITETDYLCGSKVEWEVNCSKIGHSWKKDCPKSDKDDIV